MAATIYIVADNDQAGEAAAQSAASRFYGQGRAVKIVRPVGAKDLNDLIREAGNG
jgi:DNA primase